MTAPRRLLVSRWYGAFVLEGEAVRAAYPFPTDATSLRERARLRRTGALAPEEERLLAEHPAAGLQSRDRRFEPHGVRWAPDDAAAPPPVRLASTVQRDLLLSEAAEALKEAWDPSVHVEEAVRSLADLERMLNLLAERLTSWAGRDTLASEVEAAEDPRRVAEALRDGYWAASEELPGIDPALTEGRRALAGLYLEGRRVREALETAVAKALPARAPNLSELLGPELAARLISQAGGLDRLARLPASTVQVLGAERAFFEHLRGHAPPPRHGLLFLHPDVQSSPRSQRGKLARALAGKAAIAARLDLAGAPLRPELGQAFARRAAEIREGTRSARGARRGRSVPPLDRAAKDR